MPPAGRDRSGQRVLEPAARELFAAWRQTSQNDAMQRIFYTLCFLAAASACPELPAVSVQDKPNASLHILILNSFDESTEPFSQARSIFMTELQRTHPANIIFRQFDLDERSHYGESNDELKAQLLRRQYTEEPLDLVLALGPPALEFWLSHRDSISGQTPMIVSTGEYALQNARLRPGDAVIVPHFSFPELVENIVTVAPGTSRILMVFGSSAVERRFSALAKEQLKDYSGQIAFEYANDLSVVAVSCRKETLTDGSAVLYGVFDSDVNGVTLPGHSGLVRIRAASRVPVFGSFDMQLGLGIVGGRLIQIDQTGSDLARTAEKILRGVPLPDPLKIIGMGDPVYDWRELQAWDIDAGRLPPASAIRFQSPPFWKEYLGSILLAALAVAAQTLLVIALLLQQRRWRQAEQERVSLASRLITAHEDEHRRIARELHDDLAQRLARLSIDASYLASNFGSEAAQSVLQTMQPELARIGKDIHDMSYRLHPSVVEDLGLVTALRTECDRVRQHSNAAIIENISMIPEPLPRDTALGVYRIAQEALHNAVKHSAADTIEVTLAVDASTLTLAVRDYGKGFDVSDEAAGQGLGLSSMRERARLANGTLTIRSWPGRGTWVLAKFSLKDAIP